MDPTSTAALAGDNYLERLERRARRTFTHPDAIKEAWASRRAIVAPGRWPAGEKWTLAAEAKELLSKGQRPAAHQIRALELAIRMIRPAPLSRAGRLDDLSADAALVFSGWDGFQQDVAPYLYSVGRVDDAIEGPLGTCFVVAEDVVATNRHVFDLLSRGTETLASGQGSVRFQAEFGGPGEKPVPVKGVLVVSEEVDLALLTLQTGSTRGRPPLQVEEGSFSDEADVVVLGYPLNDSERNPLFVTAIFGNSFRVKRGAPGMLMGRRRGELLHDCSTLGGNSGSPVLSLESGRVVAVHSSGFFCYRNAAVPAESLGELLQAAGAA